MALLAVSYAFGAILTYKWPQEHFEQVSPQLLQFKSKSKVELEGKLGKKEHQASGKTKGDGARSAFMNFDGPGEFMYDFPLRASTAASAQKSKFGEKSLGKNSFSFPEGAHAAGKESRADASVRINSSGSKLKFKMKGSGGEHLPKPKKTPAKPPAEEAPAKVASPPREKTIAELPEPKVVEESKQEFTVTMNKKHEQKQNKKKTALT